MSLDDATSLLRGKPGESVAITVLHEGEEKPVEVTVVREVIPADTVRGDTRNVDGSWNFFLEGRDRIGYVRVSSFTENTVGKFKQALDWLVEHKMRGLVLDLRDDPGGYVNAAIDVCDLLVRSGVIVTTRGRDGRIGYTAIARGDAPFIDFPIAVLINQNSASAAEIVAACLQDHHRAAIVGQRSYGKGTIQEIIDLESGCGAMKLTTASYWRPNGKNIARPHNAGPKDTWGVTPDEGCEIVVKDDEFNRWQSWRFHRDMFHSPANGAAAKTGAEPGRSSGLSSI
jgi:carboxyl-terminal processing protease